MAKITTDTNCEMIKIEDDKGNCLFYGNQSDFNRDAKTFKTLFEKLDVKTEVIEKYYDEW
jgi:hypothetical protein